MTYGKTSYKSIIAFNMLAYLFDSTISLISLKRNLLLAPMDKLGRLRSDFLTGALMFSFQVDD